MFVVVYRSALERKHLILNLNLNVHNIQYIHDYVVGVYSIFLNYITYLNVNVKIFEVI